MRLADFLSTAGGETPAPVKPVRFKVVGKSGSGDRITAEVEAVLAFVDETDRQKARRDALAEVHAQYGKDEAPQSAVADEISYQILFYALRDQSDSRKSFCQNVRELKNALTLSVRDELIQEYSQFIEAEFPPWVDQAEFDALVKEAEGKSLADLLSSGDSSKIRRAMPSLVAHFAK